MATVSEISETILEPMRAMYRMPRGIEDADKALSEYAKALKRWTIDELESGFNRIKDNYKRRDWPSIWELQQAIREARVEFSPPRVQTSHHAIDDVDTRTPEQKARVTKLLDIWRRHGKSFVDTWNDLEFQEMCAESGNYMPPPRIYPIDPVMTAWQQDKKVMDRVQASDAGASESLKSLVAKQRAKQ